MPRSPNLVRSLRMEAGKDRAPGELTSSDLMWLARQFELCEPLDMPLPRARMASFDHRSKTGGRRPRGIRDPRQNPPAGGGGVVPRARMADRLQRTWG